MDELSKIWTPKKKKIKVPMHTPPSKMAFLNPLRNSIQWGGGGGGVHNKWNGPYKSPIENVPNAYKNLYVSYM
jgi:hypothetical protein